VILRPVFMRTFAYVMLWAVSAIARRPGDAMDLRLAPRVGRAAGLVDVEQAMLPMSDEAAWLADQRRANAEQRR
jgi:hypothetical protein